MTTATQPVGEPDHWLVARRDAETGIESLHAHFNGHAYDAHDHDDMLGQPMLVFAADLNGLQAAHRQALSRELTIVPYVHAMFSTGHDAANRDVFRAGDAENLDFVGLALRGPKKAVEKAVKGLVLHA